MTLAVPTPTTDLANVDWAMLETMSTDRTLWTVADIAEFFGLDRTAVYHWERACLNYQLRGATRWPPTGVELRTRMPVSQDRPPVTRDWWPHHPTVLPPVDVPGTSGRNRWFKGTLVAWGLCTKRINLQGEPVQQRAGTRTKGRVSPRRGVPRDQAAKSQE